MRLSILSIFIILLSLGLVPFRSSSAGSYTFALPLVTTKDYLLSERYLAMSDGSTITIMSADGGNRTEIVQSDSEITDIQWSPTGDWLSFQKEDEDNILYLVRSDGSDLHTLPLPLRSEDSIWAPTIDTLAFITEGDDVFGKLYLYEPDTQIVNFVATRAGFPVWSSDSRYFAYYRRTDEDYELFQLYLVNTDDMKQQFILDNLPLTEYNTTYMTWSPTDNVLTFIYNEGQEDFIYAVTPQDIRVQRLNALQTRNFAWSPDGEKIVYYTYYVDPSSKGTWLLDVASREEWKISDFDSDSILLSPPVISPQNNYVLNRVSQNTLSVIPLNGAAPYELTLTSSPNGSYGIVSWSYNKHDLFYVASYYPPSDIPIHSLSRINITSSEASYESIDAFDSAIIMSPDKRYLFYVLFERGEFPRREQQILNIKTGQKWNPGYTGDLHWAPLGFTP